MAQMERQDFRTLADKLKAAKLSLQGAEIPKDLGLTLGAAEVAARTRALPETVTTAGNLVTDTQPTADLKEPARRLIIESLHHAVSLEFATIPLYLTALWSILDQAHPIAKSVRAIIHEEMLHLSLLCNLLVGLGEEPILTESTVPRYPGAMPGGLHPELTLRLEGLCTRSIATFMEIERPENPIPIEGIEQEEDFPQEDRTIGEFYEALLALFQTLDPKLDPARQIAGPFTWFVMTDLAQVKEAIGLIMAQGEGARGTPYARYPRYLSHYYRFKSISLGRELVWNETRQCLELGETYPPISVHTLAPPPSAGYSLASPGQIQKLSRNFGATYSEMLRLLDSSWHAGGDAMLVRAIERMFDLGVIARSMMQIPTPDGRGHCPTFHYTH